MTWIHDLPESLLCVFIVGAFVAVALAGMFMTRGRLRKMVSDPRGHNDLVGFVLAAISVFYGLLLGLVAVGAWENHAEAESLVARESTYIAALYRDISDYPDPTKSELEGMIAEYARFVIEDEWPQQRRGVVPAEGLHRGPLSRSPVPSALRRRRTINAVEDRRPRHLKEALGARGLSGSSLYASES